MGGFDLYITTVDKDGYFSETKNLGYPINTWSDESSLIVSKNYSNGFFSSNRGNIKFPNLDLYFFDFPDEFKTNKIIELSGQIIDKISYNISNSKISFLIITEKILAILFLTKMVLFYNFFEIDSLIIHIDSKDHIFYTQNLHLNKKSNKNLNFILDRKIKGSKVVLENILYETNNFSLKSSSFFEIKRLANHLKRNKKTKILIAGHTDNLGTEKYNQELSFKRARSVYNKLIEFGVSKNQLSYIVMVSNRTNETEIGKRQIEEQKLYMINKSNNFKIIECPRDAMQGIYNFIPTENKAKYINSLLKVGFDIIDFGSFVSPKAVPQMRDTAKLINLLQLNNNTSLLSVVLNKRGALEASDQISL